MYDIEIYRAKSLFMHFIFILCILLGLNGQIVQAELNVSKQFLLVKSFPQNVQNDLFKYLNKQDYITSANKNGEMDKQVKEGDKIEGPSNQLSNSETLMKPKEETKTNFGNLYKGNTFDDQNEFSNAEFIYKIINGTQENNRMSKIIKIGDILGSNYEDNPIIRTKNLIRREIQNMFDYLKNKTNLQIKNVTLPILKNNISLHRQKRSHRYLGPTHSHISPDDYFCPINPNYFDTKFETAYSASNNHSMFWNGLDLILTSGQIGLEKQCLNIDFIGPNFAELIGWKIRGYIFPESYQRKFTINGGVVKSYTVSYKNMHEQWKYIMEEGLPKVFITEGNIVSACDVTEEILPEREAVSEVQFCPLSAIGDMPIMHVELFGCKLFPKNEFSFLYFDEKFKEPYSCMNSFIWLTNKMIFSSNAGMNAQSASFNAGGFQFSALKDEMNGENNECFYLQMDLSKLKIVVRIKIAGGVYGMSHGTVSEFTAKYLSTDNCWKTMTNEDGKHKIFDIGKEHIPTASSDSHIFTLPHAIVTKSIKIFPTFWWGYNKVLRVDVQACDVFPVQDKTKYCPVPYNLMTQSVLLPSKEETYISDDQAHYDDPNGFVFKLNKAAKWKNKNIFLRVIFPEEEPRRVTALVMKGGQTYNGDIGFITEFILRYGDNFHEYDEYDESIKSVTLSIFSATAIIKHFKAEACEFIFIFTPSLEAKFIDFYPQNWKLKPIVRILYRGCHACGHPYVPPYFLESGQKMHKFIRKIGNASRIMKPFDDEQD